MRMRMRTKLGIYLAVLMVSGSVWAKQAHSASRQSVAAVAKHAKSATAVRLKKRERTGRVAQAKLLAQHVRYRREAAPEKTELPSPDEYVGPMRVIGPREIGKAAWYGAGHLGARTASGEPLDAIHPTAAHRSLPLYSLVRVTNLSNGRSAVAKINDRGPVSHSLAIDLSPRVADELDMKHAGIARVVIEPVAEEAHAQR